MTIHEYGQENEKIVVKSLQENNPESGGLAMKYTVMRIDEDIDFGCEERAADAPVMAVVTLRGQDGEVRKLRQPDRMLYDRDINEGDTVVLNEKKELQKSPDND